MVHNLIKAFASRTLRIPPMCRRLKIVAAPSRPYLAAGTTATTESSDAPISLSIDGSIFPVSGIQEFVFPNRARTLIELTVDHCANDVHVWYTFDPGEVLPVVEPSISQDGSGSILVAAKPAEIYFKEFFSVAISKTKGDDVFDKGGSSLIALRHGFECEYSIQNRATEDLYIWDCTLTTTACQIESESFDPAIQGWKIDKGGGSYTGKLSGGAYIETSDVRGIRGWAADDIAAGGIGITARYIRY
jgi:hypothetical protein